MKKCAYVIMTCHIQWIVSVLWILLLVPTNGYIINQDGHLVPYKVYKKGMCLIHPRNCRGGSRYRKRTNAEPLAPSSDKLYELDVFKRNMDQRANSNPLLQALDSENDVYARANDKPLDRSREKSHDADLREFRKLAENQLAYDMLQQRQESGLNGDDKTAAVYNNNNNNNNNNHGDGESELFKQMLSRNDNSNSETSATDYTYKGLADPPAPDRRIGAILEEFPLYEALEELLATYNKHSGVNSDIFDPNDDLSLYEIQKRR